MQQEDWINWTPEKCKQKILEWQKTKNDELFSYLLAKYDRFLLKLVWGCRKQFSNVPLEDLYHSSVVGFGEALTQFKQQAPTRLIMAVIKAYVKTEIEARYRSKQEYESNSYRRTEEDVINQDTILDANFILNSDFLSDKERAFLRLRFDGSMTFKAIGLKYGITEQGASQRCKKIINKIQRKIKKENI